MPYNNSMALIDWRKYFDKEMLEDGKLLEKYPSENFKGETCKRYYNKWIGEK